MASNGQSLLDEDGESSDWIEIFNESENPANLAGWALTDDPAELLKWRFPELTLPSHGFLLVFASGKNRSTLESPLHTNFKLGASGEYLALVQSVSAIADEFSPQFSQQVRDISYGVGQNVTVNRIVSSSSPGRYWIPEDDSVEQSWATSEFDDGSWNSGGSALYYQTAVPGFSVRNIKANALVNSLSGANGVILDPSRQSKVVTDNSALLNFYGTGSDGHYGANAPFPGALIGQDIDDFVVEATATVTIPSAGAWTFGVNSDDGFSLTVGPFQMSFPDPRPPGDTIQTFVFPTSGDYPLELVFYERGGGAGLELFAGQGTFSSWNSQRFRLVGDTANGGLAVEAPVVPGGNALNPLGGVNVEVSMKDKNSSAYLRVPFILENRNEINSLWLRINYDDGFVAYLNGQQVATRNAPSIVAWDSFALAEHQNHFAQEFEEINLSGAADYLVSGVNILAIHGLNLSRFDSDFLIAPELVDYRVATLNYQFFADPTPGRFNGVGSAAFVADTKFSHDRGFYESPFDLSITTATEGAEIRYTTDGTAPAATTGFLYSGPIRISGTTTLRAAAFKESFEPSNTDTQTYLFLDDVIRQSPTGAPPTGWPSSWGANVVDYGMDPDVVNDPLYSGTIKEDLESIPTFSVVMNLNDLFGSSSGIYANAYGQGREWERPSSVELMFPDGAKGFQVDAGIRIRGGFSRSSSNPKHALRLFFRQEYGEGKLRYPLFGDRGTDQFDHIDLRTFQNYSWSFQGDARGIFVRDQINRDLQLAMGHPGERGEFYHLYINGHYWGLFNTCERPEAFYGETYFGGNKDDYDVIKVEAGSYTITATDGNLDAWTRLYNLAESGLGTDAAYYRIQGRNADGTPNPAYENLLDVPNLIDYMLIIFYGGNLDAPISNFLGNTSPNNWYGLRNREGTDGFRFIIHDAEHTFLNVNENRTGPFASGDPNFGGGLPKSNPQRVFQQLQANAEFRMLVADHVQRHFFYGGALTPESVRSLILKRKTEIENAVVAESARWGDSKRSTPRTRDVDWANAMNDVLSNFVPSRTSIVLNQLKAKGLYPAVPAPAFSRHGGVVERGSQQTLSSPSGTIFFTRDGTDPRLPGGAISLSANTYEGTIVLTESETIKARALTGSTWSALTEATFSIQQTFDDLLVTEIMYHPPAEGGVDGDEFEFLELKNVGSSTLDLGGAHFTDGITYAFPPGTLMHPGQFYVLAGNSTQFQSKYPGARADAGYTGRLSNGGETLQLVDAAGSTLFSLSYLDQSPWPATPDGEGFSLVPVNQNTNPDVNAPENWRASAQIGGSPSADDPSAASDTVWITEILTHTDPPFVDAIELHNPMATSVDVSYWLLTDNRANPSKFRVPPGTIIPAGGYHLFKESDFNPTPGTAPSFSLNSHGEAIYLYAADADGNLLGFSDGFTFGAAENGVSFGRYTTSNGDIQHPAQTSNSLGTANLGPRVGSVVINEIGYHPSEGDAEFIELKNVTSDPLPLYDPNNPGNTWRLNGVGFSFPVGTEIPANGLIILSAVDPDSFRTRHAIGQDVQVLGPYSGILQDDGERLQLQRPDAPDAGPAGESIVPFIVVDEVRYNDTEPWPAAADGFGPSLERIGALVYGNDPINWRASPGAASPGLDNDGNRRPIVSAGPNLVVEADSFPFSVSLSGTATDDGLPDSSADLTGLWLQVSGPGPVAFGNRNKFSTPANFFASGVYVLRLTVDDGALAANDEIIITIEQPTSPITLIPRGSTWRYLDSGASLGTVWRAPSFFDSPWESGVAQFGYGDGDENTIIGFGSNSASKFITTYFRKSFSVSDESVLTALTVSLLRDDGAIGYLNGTEVFRSNMPGGNVSNSTLAASVVGGADESSYFDFTVDPQLLLPGNNVLAVEIHQAGANSSDVSFDLELTGFTIPITKLISGTVRYYSGEHSVPGAVVNVDGDSPRSFTSTRDGTYAFSQSAGGDYAVTARKLTDTPAYRGVTTLDLALIQRHILALKSFDSPYELLAADVNNSSSVTTLDLAWLRRLILAVTDSLPGGLWAFVRSDFEFGDPTNPWEHATTRHFPELTQDLGSQDFIGIKRGDVNGSWTPTMEPESTATAMSRKENSQKISTADSSKFNFTKREGEARLQRNLPAIRALRVPLGWSGSSPAHRPLRKPVTFSVRNVNTSLNAHAKVAIEASEVDGLTTAQFSLAWDPTVLQFVRVAKLGLEGLSQRNLNLTSVADGALAISWASPNGNGIKLEQGDVLLEIEFHAARSETLIATVDIGDDPTVREVTVNCEVIELTAVNGAVRIGLPAPQMREALFQNIQSASSAAQIE